MDGECLPSIIASVEPSEDIWTLEAIYQESDVPFGFLVKVSLAGSRNLLLRNKQELYLIV